VIGGEVDYFDVATEPVEDVDVAVRCRGYIGWGGIFVDGAELPGAERFFGCCEQGEVCGCGEVEQRDDECGAATSGDPA
jgi:hypothetical protein